MNGASHLQQGSRSHLMALETLMFLVLKYAFSHILETLPSLISDIMLSAEN